MTPAEFIRDLQTIHRWWGSEVAGLSAYPVAAFGYIPSGQMAQKKVKGVRRSDFYTVLQALLGRIKRVSRIHEVG